MIHDQAPPTIESRLDRLPRKAAAPFRQLLATGQLSEDIANTVLDAGELSNDSTRLIAFTAAYLNMRRQNIPVHHVITMAKSNRRRLNLAWSPSRWKEEHDKLSRYEALKRLADVNITYDVSAYTRLLPRYFPGYVIRTSRKLGMEGLRQRHCVAAYHSNLQAGTSAILAVFIDRQRWTVEIHLTGKPEAPLRIAQIRARSNVTAPQPVRATIHALLGIQQPKAADTAQSSLAEKPHLYMDNLRAVLPILRQHGIQRAIVRFDGSGDEGTIDDVELSPPDNAAAILNETVAIQSRDSVFDDGHWAYSIQHHQCRLSEAITTITDDYLEFTNVDWFNDSGGFGQMEINVVDGTVTLDVNTRYEESTSAYSADHDIATGQEL